MLISHTQKAASEVRRSEPVADGDYEQQQVVFGQQLTERSFTHFAIHRHGGLHKSEYGI